MVKKIQSRHLKVNRKRPWGGAKHGRARYQSSLSATGFWWLLCNTQPSRGDLNLESRHGSYIRSTASTRILKINREINPAMRNYFPHS